MKKGGNVLKVGVPIGSDSGLRVVPVEMFLMISMGNASIVFPRTIWLLTADKVHIAFTVGRLVTNPTNAILL